MPESRGAPGSPGAHEVERFPRTGGLAMPVLAGVLVTAIAVMALVDGVQRSDLPVLAGGLLAAVVVWLVYLRPDVRVEGESLLLRGSLGESVVPLAAIERVAVTRMLVVQAGGRRHVSTSLSRTLRSTMTSGGMAAPRSGPLGGRIRRGGGGETHDALGASSYPDFVEERLSSLAEDARARRGVRLLSAEQEALAADVRRTRSPAALGLLGAAVLLLALSLALV